MGKPVLVYFGGTLSSEPHPDTGLLVASANRILKHLAEEAGFDTEAAVPVKVDLDSIEFNIGYPHKFVKADDKHYPLLRDAVIKVLDAGDTPVICGGTDTKAWYTTLLTQDLMRLGKLPEKSGKKIIFLSSMKAPSVDPGPAQDFVRNILRAGKWLAEHDVPLPDQSLLTGGFALSSKNESGTEFTVHDVTNKLDKIAHEAVDAFRSDCPVGTINGGITFNPHYHAPDRRIPEIATVSKAPYARIAPPLTGGQGSGAMIAYMEAMNGMAQPFDGVMIEGIPSAEDGTLRGGDRDKLLEAVQALKQRHIRVVFCAPQRFKADAEVNGEEHWMNPVYPDRSQSELAKDLKKAGAEYMEGLPKDVYLHMLLTTPNLPRRISDGLVAAPPHDVPSRTGKKHYQQEAMKIRYVPDIATMAHAVAALEKKAEFIEFSALANSVLPKTMTQVVTPFIKGEQKRFFRRFDYDGTTHPDGTPVTSGVIVYDISKDITNYVHPGEELDKILAAKRGGGFGRTKTGSS
jgi:hypothetical protein